MNGRTYAKAVSAALKLRLLASGLVSGGLPSSHPLTAAVRQAADCLDGVSVDGDVDELAATLDATRRVIRSETAPGRLLTLNARKVADEVEAVLDDADLRVVQAAA